MTFIRRLVASEPVALVGVFVAVCSLIGVTLSAEDVSALTQVCTFVLPLVGAAVARQAVTPASRAGAVLSETTAEHGANPELDQ